MKRRALGALAVLLTLSATLPAFGYCRATTCNPATDSCPEDGAGCFQTGLPVFWTSSCITISVQADGAPHAGIAFDLARGSVERAVAAWTSVACPGGGTPSLQVEVDGPVACAKSEYNQNKRNANIVMFRDEEWPYGKESQDVLGFTRIRFDADTGELYDVDIELNAVTEPLSASGTPTETEVDLDSVVAHEVGHLLGLNHSRDVAATMVGGYQTGSVELRTPAPDDIQGICAIYPPDRAAASSSCTPRHGFSELCGAEQPDDAPVDPPATGNEGEPPRDSSGCSVVSASSPTRSGAATALVLALWGAALLRRSRSRDLAAELQSDRG